MEKRLVKKSFLLLSLCLFILLLVNFVFADVVINEVMYNPDQCSDTYCEWIEIYNNGTSQIDLTNWTLCSDSLLKGYVHTNGSTLLNTTFILNVSSYALITDGGSGTGVYDNFSVYTDALALHADVSEMCNNGLSNSGEVINITNSDKTYVYTVDYSDSWGGDGNNKTLIFYKNNWTESALENGTPGASNDQFAPDFNKWVNPAENNSIIGGLFNITVNITDVTDVSSALVNFNNTNFSMSQNNELWYYLWDTRNNADGSYNIVVYFNDTNDFSNSDTLLGITIDNTNPKILNPTTTANSRNFIGLGFIFNASVNATDTNLLNVTCTLSSTTVGNFSVDGDIHKCNLTAPTTEGDYTITFTAYDLAGNTNTTTTGFTTKHSTIANLTTQDITVSDLNQSDKIVEINITFNNKGSSTIYNPNIILDSFYSNFAEAINKNITCANNLSISQSCTAKFYVTIFGGKSAGTYTIFWNANWTNNNFTYNELTQAARSYVTINSNPQITVSKNRTATIEHGTNETIPIFINSTGNSNLQSANIAFTPSTLQQSWVTISPSSFSSISAATNETFNVTVAIPQHTSPSNYTGTLTITATGVETKTILLIVEVPQDTSWTSYPTTITTYKKTDSAGLLGTVYINNSGNIGQTFSFSASGSLYFYVWDNSNPTSEYVEKGTTEPVNFYHLANGPLNSYAATLTITSYKTSDVNYTYFTLTRDDNNPNINITSPLNNSFVKGLVEFNVSASDLNLSNILFYINNSLVFDDAEINYTYKWDTTAYAEGTHTLKAIAYDSAGNSNISGIITVTVNNTDDNPILISNIPAVTWDEDSITDLTLSLYFKTIDGDSLKYNFSPVNNITVNVNNNTGIANFTPNADFFGTRYIKFYAIDSSNNITPSNNITLTVNNINDAPSTPILLSPPDISTLFSAIGKVTLNWSESTDADNDPLTYYVFYGNDTNVTSSTTTQNNYLTLNLDNATTYYWKVYATDVVNNSANSTMSQFTVTYDDAPVIINFTPLNLTPAVAEGSTLVFIINASDPDSGLLNYTWYVDNIINKTDGNNFTYTPDFTASGTHTIMANITDNNSNFITKTWTITVTDTNRAPVLDTINDTSVLEDSTITFNITGSDADGDNLTYSSNLSLTISKINDNIATFSWTPTNEHVGNNTISFSVDDGSLIDSQLVIITVNNTNDAPIITAYSPSKLNPKIAADTGSQLFSVTASDVDTGDSLSYAWYLNGTSVSTTSSYTASSLALGIYNVTAIVSDSSSVTARQTWTLEATINIISSRYTGTITDHTTDEESTTGVTVDESTYGTISFLDTVNLSNAGNIDDYIEVGQGVVAIDSDVLSGLNRSAAITMRNLNYTKTPLIYYNDGFNIITAGTICNATSTPNCTNITYDAANGILSFNVPHFSTYYTGTNTTNGPPVITSTPETNATAREPYTYDVDATDPDGNDLTYSLTVAPDGMSISSTGLITWTPTVLQVGMHNVTVNVSDSNLSDTQSFNISVAEAKKLRIIDLDVKVDGKSDKNLANGDTISREAKPESDIEFKIEVENGFTDEQDLKIEDIFIEITIRDIDDGDDLEEESKEFDLRPEKDKRVTLNFKVPLEVDEDNYDVDIHLEGKDENGTTHEVDWKLYLEVKKEKHDIKIIKANLNPSIVKCEKTATLNTEIINLGREEEEEVVLEIIGPDLGINFLKEGIELEEGTEDNRYSKSLSILIPDTLKTGIYPIEINSYYDTIKLSDTKTVNLEIQECKKVIKKEEEVKAEPVVIINETKPAVKPEEGITKITFRESPAYVALLATLFVTATGVFVFALGVAMILLRRK